MNLHLILPLLPEVVVVESTASASAATLLARHWRSSALFRLCLLDVNSSSIYLSDLLVLY